MGIRKALFLLAIVAGISTYSNVSQAENIALSRRIVVIDPGHGGIDSGAVSKAGTLEKDVVVAMAIELKAAIEALGHRYEVHLTRSKDVFLSLPKRVKFARDKRADLFISLHADTLRGKTANGMTFYTLSSTASDAEAEALARKENKVDQVAGVEFLPDNPEVSDILSDLAQHESTNHAVYLSRLAVEHLTPHTQMTGKPFRSARFIVLKAPEIPSILIELGFLSSPSDEKLLLSRDWQKRTAAGLATAIGTYFDENVPVNSTTAIAPVSP